MCRVRSAAIPSRRAAVEEHRRGRACEAGRPVNARGYKKTSSARLAEEVRLRNPESLSRSSFLARLLHRSEAGLGTFPCRTKRSTVGGCQGFKGPAPSTLLDELLETSFHNGAVTEAKFALFRRTPAKSLGSGFLLSGEGAAVFQHRRAPPLFRRIS